MDPQSDVAERAPSRPLRADVARKGPVFVDLSGRRGRLVRHVGVLAGAACLGYSAVLGVGYAGGTSFAPRTLVPGRPVATEAFGREPDRAPEGRSGPSGSQPRTDAHAYAPTQHQHRRHHSGSGRPEHSAAREPDAPPSVTTRPRPAPARPAEPEPHHATPRHSPARPHPTRRGSAAGHGSTTYRTPVSAHSRTAAHQPAKPSVGSSHSRSEKSSSAAAKPSAKGSGHPQRTGRPKGTGRTTGPGHAKSPQQAQSQRPQSRTPRAPRPQSRRPQSQQRPSQSRPQSPSQQQPQPHNPPQVEAPEPDDGAAGPAGGGAPAERADAPGTEGEAS
ncbi:hypothetical protein AB0G77_17880 [Streptomyces hygroscopicus]|uniref:hypothetical protein n=1 Tax=Streptomyces hygroscopicus TaxID=1912 RepID=UPI0033E392E7